MRFLLLLLLVVGCSSDPAPFARASKIESLDQAIGGPVASARAGDYLLENDQIRAVIEQGGNSYMPLGFGGSLIDLDLARSDPRFSSGKGLDQLGQLSPTANLAVPGARAPAEARITTSTSGAEITVSAEQAPIQQVLAAFNLLLDRRFVGRSRPHDEYRFYTEYEVRPGEKLVRVTTTVGFDVPFCPRRPGDACDEACDDILYDDDCTCSEIPERCTSGVQTISAAALPDRPEPMGLSDILLGDLPRPLGSRRCADDNACDTAAGETCADVTTALGGDLKVCRGQANRDAGVLIGDMLIFGSHLHTFLPRVGFDVDSDIRRLFDSGQDTLATPLSVDTVFAAGDRVSYAIAPPAGKILIPIFGGPFSLGATYAASCRHGEPGCLSRKLIRAERWISVGEGDISTALEPIRSARGELSGIVSGTALFTPSGRPAVHSEIFAFRDPRDLPAAPGCEDLSSASDARIAALSLTELIDANRCRSVDRVHLRGTAGLENMAVSDRGTDPVLDGDFSISLPPGRWILVAQHGAAAQSSPLPVAIRAGETTRAALMLRDPGRLRYAVFDHRGEKTAARATIGRCLPQEPCRADTDCAAGTTCEAGACACPRAFAVPLEMGGARTADGIITLDQSLEGEGEVELAAGTYEVIFSKGPHYSVDRQTAVIEPNLTTFALAKVSRLVDHTGWTSADFHVHAEASLDSSAPMEARVAAFLAEDMEFLSSSDHEIFMRYEPLLVALGVRDELSTQTGVEISTQELGHFIAFPMNYRLWTETDPPQRVPGNGAVNYHGLLPGAIFDALRAAKEGEGPAVIDVPHPYTYFDAYRIDPITLEPSESVISVFNPAQHPMNFDGRFEAMELLNGKGFDPIRRPTLGEISFYSRGFDDIVKRRQRGELDEAAYAHEIYLLSTETVRRMMHRTVSEQEAAASGEGKDNVCRCGADVDCAAGLVCDPVSYSCREPADPPAAGPLPPRDAICRSVRGVVDDWFTMLNFGLRRTGVGGSDVHSEIGGDAESGSPRTMVFTGGALPPAVGTPEIVSGILEGRVVVTNGPMIHFSAAGGAIGDIVSAPAGSTVKLKVRVERADWYDVDRVEIYRNAELIHWRSACGLARTATEPGGGPCFELVEGRSLVLDMELDDAPDRDVWYVVIAQGLDGRTLSPVYSSSAQPRFGTLELTQRIFDIIPALRSLKFPRNPSLFPTFPWAITNPIWIDAGGDGWSPPRSPPPSWCTPGRDFGCLR